MGRNSWTKAPTSKIYLAHGGSYDDMKNLFAHSATSVTHRYLHDHGSGLQKVANVIRLFPNSDRKIEHPQKFPKLENLSDPWLFLIRRCKSRGSPLATMFEVYSDIHFFRVIYGYPFFR